MTARLEWTGGSSEWKFGGNIGADDCVLVGHIRTTVPDASGPMSLVLELTGPVQATNTYETVLQLKAV